MRFVLSVYLNKHSISKWLGFFLISILSWSAQAQQSSSHSKLSYGFSVALDRCDRSYETNDVEPFSTGNFNNTVEHPGNGFRVGVDLFYKLHNRAWLESGVSFVSNTYDTEKLDILINGKSFITGDDTTYITNIRNEYRLTYFYLPLKYRLILKASSSFNYYLSFGGGAMIVVEEQTNRSFIFDRPLQYHRFNSWWDVSGGLSFRLSDELDAKVEPGIMGSFNSVLKSPSKGFLLTAGIKVGVLYRL